MRELWEWALGLFPIHRQPHQKNKKSEKRRFEKEEGVRRKEKDVGLKQKWGRKKRMGYGNGYLRF